MPLSHQYCDATLLLTMDNHIFRLTWGLLEYLDTGSVETTLHTLALNRDELVTGGFYEGQI